MSQAHPPSPPRLPLGVLDEIMRRVPVKYNRQVSKMTRKGSPDYAHLLKQRGYTKEFLVELLDAVELIEPGLLEVLKTFYDFRKAHKKDTQLLTADIVSYTKTLDRIEDKDYYDRLFFIKLYYKYKVYSVFNLDWDKYDTTNIHIATHKDNLDELQKLLKNSKELKQDIHDYKQAFEAENAKEYYFEDAFIASLNAVFDEDIRHSDASIEKYEAAIRDYHARKAAEAEAKKQRTATKRLITRVNNAAAAKERREKAAAARQMARANKTAAAAAASSVESPPTSPAAPAAPADIPESSRAARARARSARRD